MAVKVQFEIGHTSKLRSKKTAEGFTHDWELYVQGVNKADISTFVEKVVFNLHDSFPKPKRAFKEPPYVLKESGYAGFLLPIDIYFRNREEPKRVQFTYDLDLQTVGPPQHRSDVKKFIFECPSEEFRQKLMKGGGVSVSGVVSGAGSTPTSISPVEDGGMVSKPKLTSDSGKKYKSRSDEGKMNSFANLFGTPITKSAAKYSPDGKSGAKSGYTAASGIGSATTTPSGNMVGGGPSNVNSGNISTKEKSVKDKDKSNSTLNTLSNTEKGRDRSEKKEKYKQISPNKEVRSGDSKKSSSEGTTKHDKREDKPKKEKTRDKDRDRSKEKASTGAGIKKSLSPRSSGRVGFVGSTSPKRVTPPRSSSSASGRGDEINKGGKTDASQEVNTKQFRSSKEQGSSSSGKKSKKEKRDRDRDRDKEKDKNLEHRDKHRSEAKTKDDRSGSGSFVNNANCAEKETKPHSTSEINKKTEKNPKADTVRVLNKSAEKSGEKESGTATANLTATIVPRNSNDVDKKYSTEKDKRSHKHKKKDKNKDKEKEKDKDKDKLKDKEKEKDKDKEHLKETEKLEPTVDSQKNESSSSMPTTVAVTTALTESSDAVTPYSSKKSQNKEKKFKEKNNKEGKRSRDDTNKNSTNNKHAKQATISCVSTSSHSTTPATATTASIPTATTQLEDTSDVDNVQSSNEETVAKASTATTTNTQHSDSSNSTFPDLQSGKSPSLLPPPSTPDASDVAATIISDATHTPPKDLKNTNTKEPKIDKTALTDDALKNDKEDFSKKRRRNSAVVSNTFVEPPIKQMKKDVNKAVSEKSKSPLMRSNVRRSSSSSTDSNTFPLPPAAGNGDASNISSSPAVCSTAAATEESSSIALSPGGAATSNSSNDTTSNSISTSNYNNNSAVTTSTHSNNNLTPNASDAVVPTLPTEYLTELQELHHKIMSLQDNDELQQVVEMIAATGCYEITAKTFDFDLCKLDRNTVQRLQEFFATSVS